MKRTLFRYGLAALTAFAAATAASGPAAAQDARDLARISAYLNGLTTAEGDFVQIAPDGSASDGKFSINRPGRIRFEYTPPNPTLVVSDGVWVVIYDIRDCSKQTAPLSQTPLELLLKERVNLGAENAVTQVDRSEGQMRVVAVDPDAPENGSMTMVFSENPLELRQWIITDGEGQTTTVALSNVRRGVDLSPRLFAPAAIDMTIKACGN